MKNKIIAEIINLKNEKKYAEAIQMSTSAFKLFKDNCFYNEIYDCLIRQNKRKNAIKILEKMLKLEPESITIHKRLAYNNYSLNNYKEALKFYKLVIELEPLSYENYFNVGSMYHYLKDYKKAYHYYYTAMKLNPKNILAFNNLGIVYFETKNYEQALDIFQRAISIDAQHPEAYHHFGVIMREYKKDLELSELYLKKAIKLDVGYADNYYQLALTQIVANKKKDAIDSIEKCLDINPNHKLCLKLIDKIN